MNLDLSSFLKAIAQTDEALALHAIEVTRGQDRLALHLRAASIQAFEFTYELSIKVLKRFLEATNPNPALLDTMSFNDLIRTGYEAGLLDAELSQWKSFRQSRGTTSHTYDETKAQEIFETIPAFLLEAKFLARQIENRQEKLE
jgi:nucleotidyltransferase substrate binding protein (TIGR01987 family)